MRVLIVEDKIRMAALLQRAVQREGYATTVAHDGEQALETIMNCHLDAIVMDVMLPKADGFSILTQMREARINVPVLFLTAKDTNYDMVRGLDLGADDYMTKPFDMNVLLARLRALVRRGPVLIEDHLKVGALILRRDIHSIECDGQVVALTPIEFSLIEVLMRRAGLVVKKDVLTEIGWSGHAEVNEETLYVFMRALRTKIQMAQPSVTLHTIRGVGYMLKAIPT